MSFDIYDEYKRAPFNLIPPLIIRDMKSRLLFDEAVVRQIMHEMLGWNYSDIVLHERTGDRDSLQKMFDMMQLNEPECVITCGDIDSHFKLRKCFPIGKVHTILKALTPVCSYLEKEGTIHTVVTEIRERRSNKDRYPSAREFRTDSSSNDTFRDYAFTPVRFQCFKSLMSRKVNVLVANITSTDNTHSSTPVNIENLPVIGEENSNKDEFFKVAFKNLVENLDRNFNCVVTPHQLISNWEKRIDGQFSKASFVVAVLAERFLSKGNACSLNSDPSPLEPLYDHVLQKVAATRVPIVGVVFDKSFVAEAEKNLIPIFLLPKELELLLDFIIQF